MHQLCKHREAILDYTSGIEICHSDPIAFYNRELSYRAIKEYEKAASDFTQAIELDCRDEHVYLNRAFCYSELGKKEMAESDLREIGGTGQRKSPKGQEEATGVKAEPKGSGLKIQ
jgi:tetratricopeptide (TPR) repeat protein